MCLFRPARGWPAVGPPPAGKVEQDNSASCANRQRVLGEGDAEDRGGCGDGTD